MAATPADGVFGSDTPVPTTSIALEEQAGILTLVTRTRRQKAVPIMPMCAGLPARLSP